MRNVTRQIDVAASLSPNDSPVVVTKTNTPFYAGIYLLWLHTVLADRLSDLSASRQSLFGIVDLLHVENCEAAFFGLKSLSTVANCGNLIPSCV